MGGRLEGVSEVRGASHETEEKVACEVLAAGSRDEAQESGPGFGG